MSSPLLWSGGQKRSVEARFDPGGSVKQRLVPEALADQLDAERQAVAAVAGGEGEAGCPSQGPDRVEACVAGRVEPPRSFARGARGEQHVHLGEYVIEVAAKRFRRLDRLDIGGER